MEIDVRVAAAKARVKESVVRCGDAGRREMTRLLTESANPWATMAEIQDKWSLGYERCKPALSFFDALRQSRAALYVQLFEHMKTKLDRQLDLIKDENGLLLMLKETIHFLSRRDLKSIPVSIIKRLKQVPDSYLHHLAKMQLLNELPLQIRRQAWELNNALFAAAIEAPCRECIAAAQTQTGVNRSDGNGPVKQLVEYIGQSESLFAVFANYCSIKCREEKQPHWGGVVRHVLMGMQDEGQKIHSLGKLDELAWLLDHCKRQGRMDVASFIKVVDMLRQLILAQATTEDRNYKKLIDELATGNPGAVKQYRQKSGKIVRRVVVKPQARPAPSPPKRRSEAWGLGPTPTSSLLVNKPQSNVAPHVLKAALRESWAFMDSVDKDRLFAEPVTEEQAPGYARIVKRPMDLSTMRANVELGGVYGDLEDFNLDVLRIFRNCRSYNGSFSPYTEYATGLNRQWKRKLAELKERLEADPQGTGVAPPSSSPRADAAAAAAGAGGGGGDAMAVESEGDASSAAASSGPSKRRRDEDADEKEEEARAATEVAAEAEAKAEAPPVPMLPSGPVKPFAFAAAFESIQGLEPKAALKSLMDQAWEYLRDLDSLGLFATPVSDLIAPGYSSVVTNPMDLSLLRIKLNKKFKSLDDMNADVQLMVSNCMLYNSDPSSEPVAFGALLRDAWEYVRPSLAEMLQGRWDSSQPLPDPPVLNLSLAEPLPEMVTGVEKTAAHLNPNPNPVEKEKDEAQARGGRQKRARVEDPSSSSSSSSFSSSSASAEAETGAVAEAKNDEGSGAAMEVQHEAEAAAEKGASPSKARPGRPRKVPHEASAAPSVSSTEEEIAAAAAAAGEGAQAGGEAEAALQPLPRLRLRAPPVDSSSSSSSSSSFSSSSSSSAAPPATAALASPARQSNSSRSRAAPAPASAAALSLVKSALLESSEGAVEEMRRQQQAVIAAAAAAGPAASSIYAGIASASASQAPLLLDELPFVLASHRLLWAVGLLRDPAVQGLLRRLLALRLSQFISFIVRDAPSSASAAKPAPLSSLPTRPADDPVLKLVMQLCQLPMDYSDAIPRLDAMLLRVQLPLLLAAVVERKRETDKEKKDKPDSAAQRVAINLPVLRNISSGVYRDSRDSLHPSASGPLAELAAPLPARTELLESVSKFVLQVLN